MTYRAIKRPFWHYTGDKSIEHGGTFYNLDNWRWGYVVAWRVTPCTDAGGPDNLFWIEELTVNIDTKGQKLEAALKCCGWLDDLQSEEYKKMTPDRRRHVIFEAFLSYGAYDIESTETVQIGKRSPFFNYESRGFDMPKDIKQLRGNTSLRNYVRSKFA